MVTPIARLTGEYLAVVVPANSPIKDAKDLAAALKADPGKVTWEDLEAAAQRAVVTQRHHRLDRRHRRVDHHLVTDAPATHALRDGGDHAGHVAPGYVREPRARLGPGEPEVHVVEGAGHRPDRHLAVPHLRVGELAVPVLAR
jgi:hypothetical protein